MPTDHLVPDEVRVLAERIDAEQGRLDVLVNDIWGGERLFAFDKPVWEHDLDDGLRLLRLGVETHAITSHFLLPLLVRRPGGLVVEMTDGTAAYNSANYRNSYFYDLVKNSVLRMAFVQAHELKPHGGTAVALTPGWLRSEMMLDAFGVAEENWRDALATVPHFCISESPSYVGRAVAAVAGDSRPRTLERPVAVQRAARPGVRLHRPGRLPPGLLALPGRGRRRGEAAWTRRDTGNRWIEGAPGGRLLLGEDVLD